MFNENVLITIFSTTSACMIHMEAQQRIANQYRKKNFISEIRIFSEHLFDPTRGRSFIVHYYAHQISNLLNAFSLLPFNRILPIYPHTCAHFFWITFFHFSS